MEEVKDTSVLISSREERHQCSMNRQSLVALGFEGFLSFAQLRRRAIERIPRTPGVYVVLREREDPPEFLKESPAGWYDGDPTVPIATLDAKWVDGCQGLYIGKGEKLRNRVRLYMGFGAGEAVAHRGGRYIWQLADSADLVVAWRECGALETARGAERRLGLLFKSEHDNRLPFANIDDLTRLTS